MEGKGAGQSEFDVSASGASCEALVGMAMIITLSEWKHQGLRCELWAKEAKNGLPFATLLCRSRIYDGSIEHAQQSRGWRGNML